MSGQYPGSFSRGEPPDWENVVIYTGHIVLSTWHYTDHFTLFRI